MTAPNPQAEEHAETIVVREAISRGFLTEEQLRETLLLREQMREANRPAPLLRLIGARYLKPDAQQELSQVYFRALNEVQEDAPKVAAEPPPLDQLMASEDELAIPEFLLEQSSLALQRPPAEDPDAVRDFLIKSTGEIEAPVDLINEAEASEGAHTEGPGAADGVEGEGKGSGLWRWIKGRLTNE